MIGAVHLRPQRFEGGQGVGVRVPVPVVGTDADQCHLGAHRCEERRVGRARTVVGDGQHVGGQLLRPIGQQVGLRPELDVAGEQHPGPTVDDPQHEGGLVQLAAGEPVRAAGRWMQDLDGQVAELHGRPLGRGADGHPARCRLGAQLARGGQLGGQRQHPQHPDAYPPQDLGHATDVIEMGVGDHHQVEMTTAVPTQPPRRGFVLTAVHQHPGPR